MENLPISILTAGSLTNTGNDVMLVTFLTRLVDVKSNGFY